MEFRVLQRMTQHKGHVKNLYNSPQMEFRKQNRYNEVLPCNQIINLMCQLVVHSRVVLKNLPTTAPSDVGPGYNEELNYYMNANYINTFVRGYGDRAFIATQAPIEYTLERFWQMIWEQKSRLIIMLCPEESSFYWVTQSANQREFGNAFQLTFLQEKQVSPGITQRKFLLKNLNSDEQQLEVTQLQNTRWEDDNAKADDDHFDDIDNLVKKIKKFRQCENPSPIVVHCSAGIGRTGTIIAIYAILESIERLQAMQEEMSLVDIDDSILEAYPLYRKVRVSVFGAVRKMREQRWNMVKKQVQYNFIYEYLERWIRKNLIDLILFNKDDFGDNSSKSNQDSSKTFDQQ
ncbi:protein tyrosine phosphatase [Stylonychia lemnae]|uniref:Protein tyrosine phosphatase n=1 Tax=Stylonychia lemnae TaxID=5949 RepID=A0A078B6K3_STYLE|nr:protein tyrosine phosphatase [Stylonychia lemnae]|eukprot:CDW89851.1 protein tyrosine phosphatase [Stylonychia lemnae]